MTHREQVIVELLDDEIDVIVAALGIASKHLDQLGWAKKWGGGDNMRRVQRNFFDAVKAAQVKARHPMADASAEVLVAVVRGLWDELGSVAAIQTVTGLERWQVENALLAAGLKGVSVNA